MRPNKHPNLWTEEETFEAAFYCCVEAAPENGVRECNWQMPQQFKPSGGNLDFQSQNLRTAWIRGWQEARR